MTTIDLPPTPRVVLASTSPYRAAQLRRLGLAFDAVPSGVDEDAWKARGLPPRELAVALAQAKAEAVAARHPDALVVAGDQLAHLAGDILGKPGAADAAAEQLLRLAGRTHELATAVAVADGGQTRTHLDLATLTMRPLTRAAAARYVAADQPLDCAGAYKFEARGAALFVRVAADDPTAIEGLPLLALCRLLAERGLELP